MKIKTAINIMFDDGLLELVKKTSKYLARDNYDPRLQRTRNHIKKLQNEDSLIVAEIGVWRGEHAKYLLKTLDIEKIYLIDPYFEYDEYNNPMSDSEKIIDAKQAAYQNMSDNSNVTTWIEKNSEDAISDIEEELDYVYIDGNHSYQYVKDDMNNFFLC